MKVILLENIRKIGSIGDIIEVKRGFARNFLISKKKALFASKQNIESVEKIKKDLGKKDLERKKHLTYSPYSYFHRMILTSQLRYLMREMWTIQEVTPNQIVCSSLYDPNIQIEINKKLYMDENSIEKNIIELLEENNVAFDIGSYRSAPPGLRIWGGPTVDNDDIKKLLPWLDWAYHKSLSDLDI